MKAHVGLVPPRAAALITSCRPEEGRRDHVVSKDDPRVVEKANAGWFRLAKDHELFSDDRKFLLKVNLANGDESALLRWVKVQLLDRWDIMGAGAASRVMGWDFGRPEFTMLSLNGLIICAGTVWSDKIGSLVVPYPHRIERIRRYAEWIPTMRSSPPDEQTAAEEWLQRYP
jgi:hypothetical protein